MFLAWSRSIAVQRGARRMFQVLVLRLEAFESPLGRGFELDLDLERPSNASWKLRKLTSPS